MGFNGRKDSHIFVPSQHASRAMGSWQLRSMPCLCFGNHAINSFNPFLVGGFNHLEGLSHIFYNYIYILWKINNVPNHQSILWIVRGSLILNPQPFHAISMNDATAATATLPPFFTMSQWWNPRWQCAPTSVQWCPRTSLRRERCPSDHRRTTEKWGWKKQCLSERIERIFFRSFSQVSFYAKKSHPKQYWRSSYLILDERPASWEDHLRFRICL